MLSTLPFRSCAGIGLHRRCSITSTVDRQDLLWQHRLYESIDRLPVTECSKHLLAFGQLSDKDGLASRIVRDLGRIELEEAALALANAAGMSPRDEMNLAGQLYLREEDLDLMIQNEMVVAGHSHEHWPASKRTATELEVDYCACMTALSQLSRRETTRRSATRRRPRSSRASATWTGWTRHG
jgi:hypothetical protein